MSKSSNEERLVTAVWKKKKLLLACWAKRQLYQHPLFLEQRNRKTNIVIREIFACDEPKFHQGYIGGTAMLMWSDYDIGLHMGQQKKLAGVTN